MDPLLERALEIANRPRARHQPDQRVPSESVNEQIVIEPAIPNARPVFWERATTEILGPAQPEFLAKLRNGPKESYWVIALYEGLPVWIRSDVLRSKQAFEAQVNPRPFERIKEPT